MIILMRQMSFGILLSALVLLGLPVVTEASEITVRPFLIDETLQPRDSVIKTITITNKYPTRKAVLYATVNEITVDATGEIKEFISPVMTDRTNTVTSWIEISRGRIELMPGTTVEVPLTLNIHPYAEPGEYHVFIGIVEGSKRYEAEAKARSGNADGVIVKITIADQREDSMRISSFSIDRFVTGDDKRTINIDVENMGDLPSAPTGEIIFYDSRGIEISSIPVNTSGEVVAPGESVTLVSSVPLDTTLGRFKANVSLNYGENQQASLFDTAFFYMMPLHLLLLVFGGILLVAIVVALLFRRSFADGYDDDDGDEVIMFVKDGHDAKPQDHDIDLKINK